MRVIFMGSPDFALPTLRVLSQGFDLIGVVTQPDRPSGRGRKIASSPVKLASLDLGITPLQPKRLSDPAIQSQLQRLEPQVIVVAAFGQILPPSVLEIPSCGCVNVHASLLPRWRGASPTQAAILHGDMDTGVTIMKMDAGLDTGPIISKVSTPILPEETGGGLSARLASLGAQLLQETLTPYCEGQVSPVPQNDALATSAPMLTKLDGILDWGKPAAALALQVRAFEPWPRSFFQWQDRRIVVRKAHSLPMDDVAVGRVSLAGYLPVVGTSSGGLVLEILQPAGRKPMPGDAFLNGSPSFLGCNLELHP
ncbi:MAG TPA: methionyl-tRNA formyltransferase [Anaerolineae bacterium]|nr:methionyl-tRNA formyltransferase [Anaerolineae bacterium]